MIVQRGCNSHTRRNEVAKGGEEKAPLLENDVFTTKSTGPGSCNPTAYILAAAIAYRGSAEQ